MKQSWVKFSVILVGLAMVAPVTMQAQDEKDKVKEKDKDKKNEQTIIIRKTGDDGKIVIEMNGDKITVNGKPIEDYKDGDLTVSRLNSNNALSYYFNNRNADVNGMRMFTDQANHAMLGVTTEKVDEGAKINDITKESAAEKIGLKPGDIITKIDETKISDPDNLSKAIRAHKAGDKVKVSYLRDKKEQTATAELTNWKSSTSFKTFDLAKTLPRVQSTPKIAQGWAWTGGSPKLGLSVQDTDDGKGVKVIEVDEDSHAAKAGVKENDVITEVDGKAVNTTDEMVKIIKESKDKNSIMVKLSRGGKVQNIEVKMPKKIKTADL